MLLQTASRVRIDPQADRARPGARSRTETGQRQLSPHRRRWTLGRSVPLVRACARARPAWRVCLLWECPTSPRDPADPAALLRREGLGPPARRAKRGGAWSAAPVHGCGGAIDFGVGPEPARAPPRERGPLGSRRMWPEHQRSSKCAPLLACRPAVEPGPRPRGAANPGVSETHSRNSRSCRMQAAYVTGRVGDTELGRLQNASCLAPWRARRRCVSGYRACGTCTCRARQACSRRTTPAILNACCARACNNR